MVIRKYFEVNVIGNKTYQNLWIVPKDMLIGKMVALNHYIRKEKKMQKINA